jgi:hypothetical protein
MGGPMLAGVNVATTLPETGRNIRPLTRNGRQVGVRERLRWQTGYRKTNCPRDPQEAIRLHLSNRTNRPRRVLRSRLAVSVPAVSVAVLLAAMPVGASAGGTPVTPASVNVSPGELADIDVSALGLESSELAGALVKIPALSTLPVGTLDSLIGGLPTNSTLQDLLAEVKAATGVQVTTGEALGVVLGDAAANPDVLSHLLGEVASLLHGTPQAGALQAVLTNLIGGLTPAQLQQLESQLGASGSPAELATTLAGKLANGELDSELATVLSGLGTTAATTGSQAATTVGMTADKLASQLGLGEEALKAASGTSTPLGSLSGVLDTLAGPTGLTLATVPTTPGGTTTTTNGGSTTTNSTSTTSTTIPGATTSAKGSTVSGKVKIISHRVKGHTLVLVVRVPSAGELTVTGAHAKRELKKSKKAATVTLRIPLTNAAVADVRRRYKLEIQLKATFKPASGAASTASATFKVR